MLRSLATAEASVCLSGCHAAAFNALYQKNERLDHAIFTVCSTKDSSIRIFKGFPKFGKGHPDMRAQNERGRKIRRFSTNKSPNLRNGARQCQGY